MKRKREHYRGYNQLIQNYKERVASRYLTELKENGVFEIELNEDGEFSEIVSLHNPTYWRRPYQCTLSVLPKNGMMSFEKIETRIVAICGFENFDDDDWRLLCNLAQILGYSIEQVTKLIETCGSESACQFVERER